MNRRHTVWSSAARRDLHTIYSYIADSSPQIADAFILEMARKIGQYSEDGLIGVRRDAFKPGLRSFAFRSRIVYFTVTDQEFRVVRIVHGHQNISPDDFSESDD